MNLKYKAAIKMLLIKSKPFVLRQGAYLNTDFDAFRFQSTSNVFVCVHIFDISMFSKKFMRFSATLAQLQTKNITTHFRFSYFLLHNIAFKRCYVIKSKFITLHFLTIYSSFLSHFTLFQFDLLLLEIIKQINTDMERCCATFVLKGTFYWKIICYDVAVPVGTLSFLLQQLY